MENWKAVVGYESIYEVSDHGRVKRIGPWSDGRKTKPVGVLSPSVKKPYGYLRVTLHNGIGKKYFQVHRLVLAAFVGPIPWDHEVNHKNGKPGDNRLENLEYMTRSENHLHAYRVLGRVPSGGCPAQPGSKHHFAKITEDDVFAIRALRKRKWPLKRIAAEFGLSIPTVCWITKYKAWKHI